MKMNYRGESEREYPISFILNNLGFDPSIFNGRMLDIGCGRQANLARHLRTLGINADGIDSILEIDETTHFMRGDSISIQKPDNFYDLAVSHYSHLSLEGMEHGRITINQVLGDNNAFERIYQERRPVLLKRIEEAMRVLMPEKSLVIWPEPRFFLKDAAGWLLERKFVVQVEPLGRYYPDQLEAASRGFTEYVQRAILTKSRKNI